MKRLLVILSILMFSFGSFANCFGKFGVLKTMYGFHAGINVGSGFVAKLIRTILMYIPFIWVYGFATFLDLVLFNLIEFWTDSNPIAAAEYDFEGKLVKEFRENGESLRLTYTKWGKEMMIEAEGNKGKVTFFAFADKPGKLFQKENGTFVERTEAEGPALPPGYAL
ncbi:hypothetical protein LPTSP3_g04960 [Leptospira kobayashii]|uniref:Lipoprotein n=1 Tax=Leptospira kobayashii TaxID=1917830 RepID=A0ABM7UQK0_9LEPT|nr:DUF3332 family protein [Leptospira kobayashii]BDA77566.1 hypothetical protein LPTSP3_g04960 [Leptospira kobayashii]